MKDANRTAYRLSNVVAAIVVLYALVASATTAYNAHNPNIRGPDGRLVPTQLTTDPQVGELTLSDNTGIVTADASTATVLKGTPMAAGAVRGGVVVSSTNGTIKLTKAGTYLVRYCAGEGVGTNAYANTFDVFGAVGAGSASVISPTLKTVVTTLTASPWVPVCAEGMVTIQPDTAASGYFLSLTAKTSSAGPITVKRLRFSAIKIDELDPASP